MHSIAPYAALLIVSFFIYATVPYWAKTYIQNSVTRLGILLKCISWPISFITLLFIIHILAMWYAPQLQIGPFHLISLGLSAYLLLKTLKAIFRLKFDAEANEKTKK